MLAGKGIVVRAKIEVARLSALQRCCGLKKVLHKPTKKI
jgi:hypothetical protein